MKQTDTHTLELPALPVPAGYRVADIEDRFEMKTGPFYCTLDEAEDPHLLLITNESHSNRLGSIHGGCLMTMMDLWLCQTAVTGFKHQEEMVTISMTNNFVGACFAGERLTARARVLRRTHRMVFAEGQITRGDDLILTSNAVLKRAKKAQG